MSSEVTLGLKIDLRITAQDIREPYSPTIMSSNVAAKTRKRDNTAKPSWLKHSGTAADIG
jgi:hypothetical protein